jgi:hypothetical protein
MEPTDQEVWDAVVDLAELENKPGQKLTGPPEAVAHRDQHTTKHLSLLSHREDFDELMNRARRFVEVRDQRREILEQSMLGSISLVISELLSRYEDKKTAKSLLDDYGRGRLELPFDDPRQNEDWLAFLLALNNIDISMMLRSLTNMLAEVHAELLEDIEFPPLPEQGIKPKP